MKQKLTYCLLAILLLASSVLPADDCVVTYKAYHGPYGQPYALQETNQYLTVNPIQTHNTDLPATPKSILTSYALDAGRQVSDDPISSSAVKFTYVATKEKPYLLIWFSVELYTDFGGHDPVLGKISVTNANGNPIGCVYSFNGDSIAYNPEAYGYKNGSAWSASLWRASMSKYRSWDVMCVDLSKYVGENIFIYAEANTCTTLSCSSVIYLAFENISSDYTMNGICYACDSTIIQGPSGFKTYTWHKGSSTGPIVGTDSTLTIKGEWNITNYYCDVSGYCGELTFVAPVQDVHSLFSYDLHCGVDNAKDTVYFTNTSFKQKRISPYSLEECDVYYWDFGNGQTSTQRNPGRVLYDKGQLVTVRLRTGIKDFVCDAWSDVTFRTCDKEDSIPLNPMPLIPVTDSIDSVVCFGTKVEWRDRQLSETGIYRDTLLSEMWGIDSVYYILNLHVSAEPVEEERKDTNSCAMVPFMWKGHLIETDTLIFDTIWTVKLGCDSIYSSLQFTLKYPSGSDTTAYVCNNNLPFIWHGKEAADGDTIILTNTVGCDSIVTLRLTIYPSGTWEETQTICDKQLPFLWKDKICTEAGDYVFDTLTTHGCDSTITLHLIVSDHAEADTVAYVCYQDLPFIWHGKEAVDGDTIILTNTVGCDSVVTLRLTISAPMTTQTADTTVCDTLLPYTWRGHAFPVVGEWRDTLRNAHGCDSLELIYTLDTFHCERPLPPVDSCLDSLVYRKWQDVLFCDNGRHEFVAYQWFRDNISLAGETNQYLYSPGGFGTNEYFVEVTYAGGKKRRTCPLSFDETPRSADTYARVQTLVRRGERLHIEISDQSAEVDILTILGQQLLHFSIGKTADLDVQLPSGVYVLILKGEQIKRTTKIMVE